MAVTWAPQLEDEVQPSLSLIDSEAGWIHALYRDGSRANIDLKTAFLHAHAIDILTLPHPVATAVLYRIMTSISYALLADSMPNSARRWTRTQAGLIGDNEGFDPQLVEAYFDTFSDRFHLIHPVSPFLQDASLYHTFVPEQSLTLEGRRARLAEALHPVTQIHPQTPSTSMTIGQKSIWGLPAQDVDSPDHDEGQRVRTLFTALAYALYSHPPTRKQARSFLLSQHESDVYPPAHAYRAATHFIPELGSVFRTLVVSMKHVHPDDLESDVPEWEWETNSKTGLPGSKGTQKTWDRIVQSLTAPRSSINMTHVALLFVPEKDGGRIAQVRRVAFNFKGTTTVDAQGKTVKMPSPATWNPFVAMKIDGKALKQTESISEKTAMGSSTLFRVALLPQQDFVSAPSALARAREDDVIEALGGEGKVRALVHAADASQEKNYAAFTLMTRLTSQHSLSPAELGRIDSWIHVGGKIAWALKKNLEDIARLDTSRPMDTTTMNIAFWESYSALFNRATAGDIIEPIGNYGPELRKECGRIFSSATLPWRMSAPLLCAKHENLALGWIMNLINEQESSHT